MHIGLVVSATLIPRWVEALQQRIDRPSCKAGLVVRQPSSAMPSPRAASLDMLLQLERTLAGNRRTWLADNLAGTAEAAALAHLASDAHPELLIDLSGQSRAAAIDQATRTLSPLFDLTEGEDGLWTALLAGRAPLISVHDSATGDVVPLALPAIEAPHRLLDSADAVLTHLVRAIGDAVARIVAGQPPATIATTPPPAIPISARTRARSPLGFASSRIARKARSKLDERLGRAPVWQVAYRSTPERTPPVAPLDAASFQRLADDGQRYYADPFVFVHAGVTHLFVEELPYASGRGIISHTVLDRDRATATPAPVLEEPHHLSYPQVFADGGHIWMLPEGAASGGLHLYRADPFPHRWVRHATLIDAPLHDATLFRHAGRWWITAGVVLGGASSWDTLALYSADRLEGPWHAHRGNPVLVDARAARPAGTPFEHGGALWRPAQDCTGGYGSALSMCRIDRLDEQGFAQTLAATLRFGAPDQHAGPHTLNFGGGYEVIDLYAPRPRPT